MPHIFSALDWAVGAFIVRGGKILLLQHKALGCWICPGGHVEINECPVDALRREVREEVGLEIEIGLWNRGPIASRKEVVSLPPPDFLDRHRITDDHWHVGMFWAAVLNDPATEPALREPTKHHAMEWFTPDGLPTPIWPATAAYARGAARLVAGARFVEPE